MSVFGLSTLTFANHRLGDHRAQINQSLERLATGKQINQPADDPSGLIITTKLDANILSIERRLTTFQQESSSLGAQDGALTALSDLLIKLNAHTVNAVSNATATQKQSDSNRNQAQSIITAIDQINTTTTFKGVNVLTGYNASNLASITYQSTNPQTQSPITLTATLSDLPQLLDTNPELAQDLVQQATSKLTSRRGAIGNRLNAIDSESRVLQSELVNTSDALSQIQDADLAAESAKLVRSQILEHATIQSILIQQRQIESMLNLLSNPAPNPASNPTTKPTQPQPRPLPPHPN